MQLVFEDGVALARPNYGAVDGFKPISNSAKRKIPSMITITPSPTGKNGDDLDECKENEEHGEAKVADFDLVIDCASYENERKDEGKEVEEADYQSLLLLLESEIDEDSRNGMKWLVHLANSEFVNMTQQGTIAGALVYGDITTHGDSTERLRSVFLKYLCSKELRLPALRVLTSSIELIQGLQRTKIREVNLSSYFWTDAFEILANNLADEEIGRAGATLSIRCLRLLLSLDPNTVGPFLRYSMLPYFLNAHDTAAQEKDRRLGQESTTILSLLGISS